MAIALGARLRLGGLAGLLGGWVDAIVMPMVEVPLAFPDPRLAIAGVSALGSGMVNTPIAVESWGIPSFPSGSSGVELSGRASSPAQPTPSARRHLGP